MKWRNLWRRGKAGKAGHQPEKGTDMTETETAEPVGAERDDVKTGGTEMAADEAAQPEKVEEAAETEHPA